MMEMKCAGCGMAMTEADVMCSKCHGPMKCDEAACTCAGCGHSVVHDQIMCVECMKKSGVMPQ